MLWLCLCLQLWLCWFVVVVVLGEARAVGGGMRTQCMVARDGQPKRQRGPSVRLNLLVLGPCCCSCCSCCCCCWWWRRWWWWWFRFHGSGLVLSGLSLSVRFRTGQVFCRMSSARVIAVASTYSCRLCCSLCGHPRRRQGGVTWLSLSHA